MRIGRVITTKGDVVFDNKRAFGLTIGLLSLTFLILALSCGDEDNPVSPSKPSLSSNVNFDIRIVSGNNQSGNAGQTLPNPLVVTAIDRNNTSVAGVTIIFTVTAGGGTVTADTVVTGSDGLASTRLTLGPISGVNTVFATSPGLPGSPTTFTATALGAAEARVSDLEVNLSLSASPTSIVANGVSTSTITAILLDQNNNPFPDSTTVIFAILPGGSGSILSPKLTVEGRASTILRSSTVPDTVSVEVRVGDVRDSVQVIYTEIVVNLTASPRFVAASGVGTSIITATVTDRTGSTLSRQH